MTIRIAIASCKPTAKTLKQKKDHNTRFILVDDATDEIIDDAQGWGYKTMKNAWKAYTWKKHHRKGDPR